MLLPALLLAAAAPVASTDEADIRRLRAASNAAIAAHDVAGVMASFAADAVTVRGSGTIVRDRPAIEAAWTEQMQQPGFDRFVRTPERIEIGRVTQGAAHAAESGRWSGHSMTARGESRPHGRYRAHWLRTDAGWRVAADVYVTLGCDGAGC